MLAANEIDHVDRLWAYLVTIAREVVGTGRLAERYYPDQPVRVEMRVEPGDRTRVELSDARVRRSH